MKKIFFWFCFVALAVTISAGILRAQSQNVIGFSTLIFTPSNPAVNPSACSKTANCIARLKVCQTGANTSQFDPSEQKSCIFIVGGSVNQWLTVTVEDTIFTKDSTGAVVGTSTQDFPLGTLRVSLTPQSTNSTP